MSQNSVIINEANVLEPAVCSCTHCDSNSCFEKRYQASKQCACNKCKNPETCLFYSNKILQESSSDVKVRSDKADINKPDINIDIKKPDEDNIKKLGKVYFEKPNKAETNKPVKDDIKKLDKSDIKICNSKCPIGKVKCRSQGLETTRLSYTSSTVDKGLQKEFTKKETYYESGTNTLIHEHMKYSHHKMPKQMTGKTEKEVTVVQSMTVSYSNAHIDSSTAELSAQVMNVPYKDFKNSISFNKEKSPKTKLTNYDILQRIKDAYNACTCKVCECIANVSPVQTEVCNCKPCECDDCSKFKSKLNETENKIEKNVKNFFDKAFETCNKSLIQQKRCNCKPCECMECDKHTPDPAPCDCKPCECIECKSMAKRKAPIKTIIVAPVEDSRRRYCQCSPCACFECGHVYGTINTHEMSTGISRHTTCRCETCLNDACDREGIDACRCDRRNKVMRKPVERDSHDFDIRRATVTSDNNNTTQEEKKKKSTNNDTIAMFAAMSQNFPGTERGCACEECACVECECQDEIANVFQSPKHFGFTKNVQKTLNKSYSCKCAPCECEICTHQQVAEQNRNCKCTPHCDCIHCAHLTGHFRSNENVAIAFPSKSINDCKPYEIIQCQRECFNNHIRWENRQREIVHPTKKRHLLKHSVSKTIESDHNIRVFNENYRKCYDNKSISPYSQVSIPNNSAQNLFVYQAFPRNENNCRDSCAKNSKTNPIGLQSRVYINEKDVATNRTKSNAYFDINLQSRNIEKFPQSCNSKDCQASESYISALSSRATTSKMSYINESGSMSPISLRTHNKSWDGSCNSSGHDHSDYLIQFPRKTIETCINDVMNLNLDRKLNFDRLNMSNSKNVYPMTGTPYPQCQHIKCCNRRHDSTMNPIPAGQIYYPKVCRNWNVENACECEQCFCDKCSYKKLQFEKCQCKCDFCNCCGVCLREDLSIFIRKNETTQTSQKVVSDRSQDSAARKIGSKATCDLVSKANIRPDSKEPEVSKDEDNLSEKVKPTTFDNSFSNRNNINDFVKEDFYQWGFYGYRSLDSYIRNNVDLFGINIYDSVHRTIKEARAFSLELMKILEKYEKANKEFESVSQKLKESHKSILDSYNAHNLRNTKESQHLETNGKLKEDAYNGSYINIDKDNNQKQENYSNVENKDQTINVKSCDNLNKSVIDITILKSEDKHEHAGDINPMVILNSIKTVLKNSSSPTNMIKDSHKLLEGSDGAVAINNKNNEIEIDTTINKEALDIIDEVLQNMDFDQSNTRENGKTHKKYKKLIKRAAVKARRNSIKSENISDLSVSSDISEKVLDDIQMNSLSITIKQLKELNDMIENDYEQRNSEVPIKTMPKGLVSLMPQVSGSTDLTLGRMTFEIPAEKRSTEAEEIKQVEESKSWKSMMKNFSLNTMSFNKFQEAKKIPYLEVEVTGAVECTSRETGRIFETNEVIATPHENKGLAKLLAEVKDICKMPLLQRQSEDRSDRDQSTSNVDFDTSSMSCSQLQCVLKKKSVGEVSSCSKGTHSMMAHHQVKDALYMPKLKNFRMMDGQKTADPSFGSSLSSVESSRLDTLKVHFQTVRRVSDHTIQVKWTAPRVMTDVQGYELLVDGRAVKKIFSPGRCMAVVTCLPHTDRLLLTIRTITSTAARQGPCPSTTIVYRPRVK